jgi:hypothetical protein
MWWGFGRAFALGMGQEQIDDAICSINRGLEKPPLFCLLISVIVLSWIWFGFVVGLSEHQHVNGSHWAWTGQNW